MSRVLLIGRLALRDLRRRPAEAVLLLLAITAAAATLALGLVLNGVASDPYESTREATSGPDIVASAFALAEPTGEPSAEAATDGPEMRGPQTLDSAPADIDGLEDLLEAPEVVEHSGPFPAFGASMEVAGQTVDVQAVGRDTAPASVDQPDLVAGEWVRDGGVVLEAGLADSLGVSTGDSVTVAGQSFAVVGVAVTAATEPYPGSSTCFVPCGPAEPPPSVILPSGIIRDPGLIWLTRADVESIAGGEHLSYVLNLKLEDPAEAEAFAAAYGNDIGEPNLRPWQETLENASQLARNMRQLLIPASWLLGLLAAGSVAVLVGGRMADQTRRVGLLKAVGGTPGLVAAVLLAEYVAVSLVAAVAGVFVGWLAAPLLTEPTAGLIGSTSAPPLTIGTVGVVAAVALGVAVVATLIPALRAARTSTVGALADAARPPKRVRWVVALSAKLPAPMLLALRVAGRRPRRVLLGVASIAVTVSGLVAAMGAREQLSTANFGPAELDASRTERLSQVLLIVVAMLVAMALVNMIFITWATVLDNRHASALARALGATPREVTAALSAAQVIPGVAGAILGIPVGLALLAAVSQDDGMVAPPVWQLLAVVPGAVLVIAVLTSIPARSGARHPVTESLQAELA